MAINSTIFNKFLSQKIVSFFFHAEIMKLMSYFLLFITYVASITISGLLIPKGFSSVFKLLLLLLLLFFFFYISLHFAFKNVYVYS